MRRIQSNRARTRGQGCPVRVTGRTSLRRSLAHSARRGRLGELLRAEPSTDGRGTRPECDVSGQPKSVIRLAGTIPSSAPRLAAACPCPNVPNPPGDATLQQETGPSPASILATEGISLSRPAAPLEPALTSRLSAVRSSDASRSICGTADVVAFTPSANRRRTSRLELDLADLLTAPLP